MKKGLLASAAQIESPPMQAALAALVAGTFATVVQVLLWMLTATPVLDTLLRDARLTAAIIMGKVVLAAEPVWRRDVLLVSTLLHFGLSFIYAAIALPVVQRLSPRLALVAGALYGLAIYALNLHGFTLVFPWFVVSRGWVTILAHVAFGVSLAWACGLFPPPADVVTKPRASSLR